MARGREGQGHRAGAPHFGAAWPGFIGALPLDNTPSAGPWSRWFGERRLMPYLRMSVDRGALGPADLAAVEALVSDIAEYAAEADDEPPARIHGDLWPGNLLWSTGGPVYLIDPAAHGGHRESDLAQLSLFGGAAVFWLFNSLASVIRGTGRMLLPAGVMAGASVPRRNAPRKASPWR